MSSLVHAQINCLFCLSSVNTHHYAQQPNQKMLTPSDIISCCSKHLSKEFIDSLKWTNVFSTAGSLCQECYNIAEHLNNLNINLNKILEDLNELGTRLNIRISEERRNFDGTTQKLRGLTHSGDSYQAFGSLPNTDTDPNWYHEALKLPAYHPNVNNSATQTDEVDNFDDTNGSFSEAVNSDSECQLSPGKPSKANNKRRPRKCVEHQKGKTVSKRFNEIITGSEPQGNTKNELDADFKCDTCSKKFSTMATLKSHDCSKQSYECDVCQISFFSTAALKRHMLKHTGEKPYNCEICKKSFAGADGLRKHMLKHTGKKSYRCEICKKSFTGADTLKKHMRSHSGEKPYNCEVCNNSFSGPGALKVHMRTHTGEKPYTCEVCNKAFSTKCALDRHKLSHTGEKPYTCDICNKSYTRVSQLKIHRRTHTGEKPYKCETCGKGFRGRVLLTLHVRIHTQERPFKCTLCEKTFGVKNNLRKHLLTHEENKKYMCERTTQKLRGLTHSGDSYQAFGSNSSNPNTITSTERNDPNWNYNEGPKLPVYDQNVNNSTTTADKVDNFDDTNGSISEAVNSDSESQLSPEKPSKCNKRGPRKCVEHQKEIPDLDTNTTGKTVSKRFNKIITGSESQGNTKNGLDSDFKCDNCGKKFSTMATLKSHDCSQQTYECDVCEISFFTTAALKRHMLTHTGEKPYNCEICNKFFGLTDTLKKHMRSHTGEKPYNCEVCNKSFSGPGALKGHMRTHTGEKPYTCDVCNKAFSTKCALHRHKLSHTGEKPYTCDICNKSYTRVPQLKMHRRTHTGEKPYKCETCGKCFRGRVLLTLHVRIHTNERPFKCTLCEKTFGVKNNLRKHFLTHKENKKYKCDICSKSLSSSQSLIRHLKSHTQAESRNVTCKICGVGFKHETALRIHEQYKHLINDERPQQCDVCEKCFPTQASLKSHMQSHSGIRPFLCEECGNSFTTANHLAAHIRSIHTKEAVTCELCGKIYRNSTVLKRHHTSVHRAEAVNCEKCERVFNGHRLLLRHLQRKGCENTIKLRQIVRPFPCSNCEKSFPTEYDRRKHQLKHLPTHERPSMVCEVCNLRFRYIGSLKTHYKNCHPESPCPIEKGTYPCKMCKSDFTHLQYVKHLEKHTREAMIP